MGDYKNAKCSYKDNCHSLQIDAIERNILQPVSISLPNTSFKYEERMLEKFPVIEIYSAEIRKSIYTKQLETIRKEKLPIIAYRGNVFKVIADRGKDGVVFNTLQFDFCCAYNEDIHEKLKECLLSDAVAEEAIISITLCFPRRLKHTCEVTMFHKHFYRMYTGRSYSTRTEAAKQNFYFYGFEEAFINYITSLGIEYTRITRFPYKSTLARRNNGEKMLFLLFKIKKP